MKVLIEGTRSEIRAFLENAPEFFEPPITQTREMKSCGCDQDDYCKHDLIAEAKNDAKSYADCFKLLDEKYDQLIVCRNACVGWRKKFQSNLKREDLSQHGRDIWDAAEPFMPKEAPNANG